jgi:hypothetical protein
MPWQSLLQSITRQFRKNLTGFKQVHGQLHNHCACKITKAVFDISTTASMYSVEIDSIRFLIDLRVAIGP